MLDSNPTNRQESQNQDQLSISNGATHNKQYPFLKEFSDLIAGLSRKDLVGLLTHQQKLFAKAIWEAENYGGSIEKCKKRLKELHGSKWHHIVSIKDHMADIHEYFKFVLLIDHKKQWDDYQFWGNISENKVLE